MEHSQAPTIVKLVDSPLNGLPAPLLDNTPGGEDVLREALSRTTVARGVFLTLDNGMDKEHLRFYRGRSMRGTFRTGDCLSVRPVTRSEVRTGDVVVFRRLIAQVKEAGVFQDDGRSMGELHQMEESQPVDELVHRVVAIQPAGLVTRGDHNPCADSTLVTERNLVGRVISIERGGTIRPVRGGQAGLWHARFLRAIFAAWGLVTRLGRVPYRGLRASGLVARLWSPRFTRLRLAGETGPLVKYLFHGRTVARWWPQQGRFVCQKPFDLVLRRKDLSDD